MKVHQITKFFGPKREAGRDTDPQKEREQTCRPCCPTKPKKHWALRVASHLRTPQGPFVLCDSCGWEPCAAEYHTVELSVACMRALKEEDRRGKIDTTITRQVILREWSEITDFYDTQCFQVVVDRIIGDP